MRLPAAGGVPGALSLGEQLHAMGPAGRLRVLVRHKRAPLGGGRRVCRGRHRLAGCVRRATIDLASVRPALESYRFAGQGRRLEPTVGASVRPGPNVRLGLPVAGRGKALWAASARRAAWCVRVASLGVEDGARNDAPANVQVTRRAQSCRLVVVGGR